MTPAKNKGTVKLIAVRHIISAMPKQILLQAKYHQCNYKTLTNIYLDKLDINNYLVSDKFVASCSFAVPHTYASYTDVLTNHK